MNVNKIIKMTSLQLLVVKKNQLYQFITILISLTVYTTGR